jgi:single-stranded-DNA-specific exonuclease
MKWIEPKLTIPNNGMIDGFPNSILLAEQLSARGFQNRLQADRFLNPENYIESSPYDFPQMDRTIKRILSAVEKKEKIGIWGDFDVDGQTSTAVLLKALQTAGTSVSYHIPVRKLESHGIQKKYLTNFVKDEAVDLLITCDTGITEFESIRSGMRKQSEWM